MNGWVVMFVDSVEKANTVVESGIVIKDAFVSVTSLVTPATRVTVSNIPPFIEDEVLRRELWKYVIAYPGNKQTAAESGVDKDPPGQTEKQMPSGTGESQVQSEDAETKHRTEQVAGDKSVDRPHSHTEGQTLNDSGKSAEDGPTVVPAVTAVDTVRNTEVVLGENGNVLKVSARKRKQKNKKSGSQVNTVAVGEEVVEEDKKVDGGEVEGVGNEKEEDTGMGEGEAKDCTGISQPIS
ncbi:hypothetical protein F2P81_002629 [Scophthalmus maximus]|uniref:Uncharacterized protein n=1 Tax=Scophthalmus maximus TaxID=52904 RepID=A0A6A4TR72_SCOMX|nr:hypothetical protein F2P81_002629 [Scophthalmus maximus]